MEDLSYDGTEETPKPTSFRPPPMHTSFPPSSSSRSARQLSISAISRRLAQESSGVLSMSNNSSFESSTSYNADATTNQTSGPPSPLSRPSNSLLLENDQHSKAQTPSRWSFSQPPISEVRVENDSFFECFDEDDEDFVERTERSLRLPTPRHSGNSVTSHDNTMSLLAQPAQRDRFVDAASSSAAMSTSSSQQLPSQTASVPASPSPMEVSRVHESALQALLSLKQELVKSQARNQIISLEKKNLERKLHKQELEWNKQVTTLEEALASKKEELEELSSSFQQERTTWEAKLGREKKEALHRKLASDNRIKEARESLEATKKELVEATQRHTQLAQEHSTVVRDKAILEQENLEFKRQIQDNHQVEEEALQKLKGDVNEKEKQIAQMTMDMSQMKETHRKEMDQWRTKWKEQQDTLEESKAQKSGRNGGATVRFQEPERPPLEPSVADRLARMRDSAERAHLIKTHKREIARLKMEHNQVLQKLEARHEEALRATQEEVQLSLASKMDELRLSLKKEHDAQIQKIQEGQQQKFAEMQKELMDQQQEADEALQKALGQISDKTQQYEREVSHRASTELKVAQLKNQLEDQRRDLQEKYAKEIENMRENWKIERDTLLTMIQRDCNTAFEHHRRGGTPQQRQQPQHSHEESPHSVDHEFFSVLSEGKLTVDTTVPPKDYTLDHPAHTNLVSPAYSEIDEVLRETENLIQSIM